MFFTNQNQTRLSLSAAIAIVGIAASGMLVRENVYYGVICFIITLTCVVIVNMTLSVKTAGSHDETQDRDRLQTSAIHDSGWKKEKLYNRDFSKIFRKESKEVESVENDKLEKILAYTRKSFIALQFNEDEVLFICHQVEHFIRYGTTDDSVMFTIDKKGNVTQASLKNFSWNIAYQYGISRAETTKFVMKVFCSWFANAEPHSVYSTLKTTTGSHAIEISTHII